MGIKTTSANPFIKVMDTVTNLTKSANGALKYKSTGNSFVDQFTNASRYRECRNFKEIITDSQKLWDENPLDSVKFILYLRTITRKCKLDNGVYTKEVQKGQGLKHESLYRMYWLALAHPDTFWANIKLYLAIASWKDIFVLLRIDLINSLKWENKALKWNQFGKLILAGLENPETSELVKKYLPQIRNRLKCTTEEAKANNMIAKWICSLLFKGDKISNYAKYRKLKTSGTAHQWQQLISQERYLEIDFNTIHGRALAQLVSSNFLINHNLYSKYETWLATKKDVKYTGYVYELFKDLGTRCNMRLSQENLSEVQKETINKQFLTLVDKAKKDKVNNFLTVIDTSGSMTWGDERSVEPIHVALSMALYFSYIAKGTFSNSYLEFSHDCHLKSWIGETPVDKMCTPFEGYCDTNFVSIAEALVEVKNSRLVREDEFPEGMVCITDSEFNYASDNKTNCIVFREKLIEGGFTKEFVDNFKIILWDVGEGNHSTYEGLAGTPNVIHMSGLDATCLDFLLNNKQPIIDSLALFRTAMSQEILNSVTV